MKTSTSEKNAPTENELWKMIKNLGHIPYLMGAWPAVYDRGSKVDKQFRYIVADIEISNGGWHANCTNQSIYACSWGKLPKAAKEKLKARARDRRKK